MNDQQRAAMTMALEALELLACEKQTMHLLWWQIEARKPLAALREALSAFSTETCSASAQPQGEPVAYPDVVLRVLRFAGKTRRQVSNPCLTANDCIELADWMVANHRANENCECNYCLNHFTPPVVPQGEPVAWRVTGQFEDIPFKDLSSAEAYRKGLNDGYGSDAYSISPLYTTPPSSQLADAAVEAAKEKQNV